jgi:serine/threonine protein kinase/tetratricopeptide (TPR) repeat protein
MPTDPERVLAILRMVEAVQGSARRSILDRECANEDDVRARVEAILEARLRPSTLIDSKVLEPASTSTGELTQLDELGFDLSGDMIVDDTQLPGLARPPEIRATSRNVEGPGSRIGPYRLIQRIGEGGMGSVYLAEQERPVRRRVALKIIKPGMDSEQVIGRFEAERQALAMMDHPSIARVLDAGTTESGRPYFVMELVDGIPITEFCDKNQLNPRARLELLVPVCLAIQHAHQKGIIHRDIKPSNILVTRGDGAPVPKVIDFGIAKATNKQLTERTLYTECGAVIGTLEYMSPEQAAMSPLGIDTRSDVYSLGVVLYELLTGSTPLEHARLQDEGYVEILKRIKEEDPPKPSTRLGTSAVQIEEVSALRGLEPADLRRFLKGEIDWIVMKALDKDRNRRYETANGLARDIQRFLADETVEACPPSTSYRLQKLARRYRVALATLSAFAAMLILGAAISTWQAIRATTAEHRAERDKQRALTAEEASLHERDRALAAEAKTRAEEEKARKAAATAQAVLEFFEDNILAAARPEGQAGGLGKDVTLRAAVDSAEPKITESFQDKPIVEAYVRHSLGATYRYLGEPAKSVAQLERALETRVANLGPEHQDTLDSQYRLASAYKDAGQFDRAIALLEKTLLVRVRNLGEEHPVSLETRNELALSYRDAGQFKRAIAEFERTLIAEKVLPGPDDPQTLTTQNNLALAYRDDGQLDRAIALFEETLPARAKRIGIDHPDTLLTRQNLAMCFREIGLWDRAISLFEQTVAAQISKLGAEHPQTLLSQNNLGPAYTAVGQYDRAIMLLERTVVSRSSALGPNHPSTFSTQNNLALSYLASGQTDRAIRLFERTLEGRLARLGPNHPSTLTSKFDLALALHARGDTTRAEALLREVLTARRTASESQHPQVGLTLSAIGLCLVAQEKWAEAEPFVREALAILSARPRDDWTRYEAQVRLGYALLGQRKYIEAESMLLDGYEGLKGQESRIPAPSKPRLIEAASKLGDLYEALGKPKDARKWRSKAATHPTAPPDTTDRKG